MQTRSKVSQSERKSGVKLPSGSIRASATDLEVGEMS